MGLGNTTKKLVNGKQQERKMNQVKNDSSFLVRMPSEFKKELQLKAINNDLKVQTLVMDLLIAYVKSEKSHEAILKSI